MSNPTSLTQAAKQFRLEDLLMGEVDLDFMFGVDAEADDDLDDWPLQPQLRWPISMPFGWH